MAYGYKSYSRDPFWLNAKYGSYCKKCNKQIKTGDKIFYYPITKSAYCTECGKHAERDFIRCVEMETGQLIGY